MEACKAIVGQNLVKRVAKVELKCFFLGRVITIGELVVGNTENVLDKAEVLPRVVKHALDVLLSVEKHQQRSFVF